MSIRNAISLALIVASLVCLYPGLTMSMFTIYVGATLPLLGEIALYEETQSIIQTIRSLFAHQNYFVAILILLFSVLIPFIKALLLLTVLLFRRWVWRSRVYRFVALIGKWSMADVFVVAVLMALLATNSNDNIDAVLHHGFYYFTAYCLISILGIQLLDIKD